MVVEGRLEAVFWSRIVGTRATGSLPFFTICYFAVVEVCGHQNIGRLAIVEFVAKQIEEEKNRMQEDPAFPQGTRGRRCGCGCSESNDGKRRGKKVRVGVRLATRGFEGVGGWHCCE